MASTEQEGALPLPTFEGFSPNILLVVAPFYRKIADDLIAGARRALEIPPAIRMAHTRGGYEGYVALGCIIRGETYHFELVCNESGRGLTLLGLEGLAIGNGVLTPEDMAQAVVRADPSEMDKGGGAAAAALHLVALARRFAG